MSSKTERGGLPSLIRNTFGVPEPYGLMRQPDVPTFPVTDLLGDSTVNKPDSPPVVLFDAVSGSMSPDWRMKANSQFAKNFVRASRRTDQPGKESLTHHGMTEPQRMAAVTDAFIAEVRRDPESLGAAWEPTDELSRQAHAASIAAQAKSRGILGRLRHLSRDERVLARGIAQELNARTAIAPQEAEKIVEEKRVFDALRTAAVADAKEAHPGKRRKDRIAREQEIALGTSALWDAYQAAEFSDSGQLVVPSEDATGVYARLAAIAPQIEARKAGVHNAATEWDDTDRTREIRRVRAYMNRVTPLEQQILKEATGLAPETTGEKWGRYGNTLLVNASVQGVKDAASWAGGIAAAGADILGLMNIHSPRDVAAAVGTSYALWGVGLNFSLRENWNRLEKVGNSVSALSLGAYERAKMLFPDSKFKQEWRTAMGYLATDLTQEVAYYLAAGLAWLSASGANGAEVLIGGNLVAAATEIGQAIISKRLRTKSQKEASQSGQGVVVELNPQASQLEPKTGLVSVAGLANTIGKVS